MDNSNIVFHCDECSKAIIRDSREHDQCICNGDGDRWWCEMCHNCDECKKYTINPLDEDSWNWIDDEVTSVLSSLCAEWALANGKEPPSEWAVAGR